MAKIRVYRDEMDGDEFPRLCVCCGADADQDVDQQFAWMPGWVHILILTGLAPWLIVCCILRKTTRVNLPVCYRHRNHWRNRKLYIGLGLLGWVATWVALALVADDIPKGIETGVFAACLIGCLLWLITGLIYSNSAIKARKMTDRWIELVGVDKRFAAEWRDIVDARPDPAPRRPRRPVGPREYDEV